MKKLLILPALLFILAASTLLSKAQKIYDFFAVDKVNEYPGGMNKFYEYLGKNIKYPEVAKKNKTQGKVWLSFIIEKDVQLTI